MDITREILKGIELKSNAEITPEMKEKIEKFLSGKIRLKKPPKPTKNFIPNKEMSISERKAHRKQKRGN